MKNNRLPVSETFYSIQGEGKTAGAPAVFLRLGGCNLMCGGKGTERDKKLHNLATWRCDTIEVWTEFLRKPFSEVLSDELLNELSGGAHLVITGGEPLLHQEALLKYLEFLAHEERVWAHVEIETNGTIALKHELYPYIQQVNCSPKLSNSGNDRELYFKPEVIKQLSKKAHTIFKFVISRKEDWEEIEHFYLPLINKYQIYLMPAGATQKELSITAPLVAEICKKIGVKYSPLLQVDIWNKATGV